MRTTFKSVIVRAHDLVMTMAAVLAAFALRFPEAELARRRAAMDAKGAAGWQPLEVRPRRISPALQAYAAMATSAASGAVRDVSQVERG